MKIYQLNLSATELRIISSALGLMDITVHPQDPEFGETVLKVGDQMNQYYDDNGITDGKELECRGHPAGLNDRRGETVYCDGSCRS